MNFSQVSALFYTPAVEVGDEIVYKIEEYKEWETEDGPFFEYFKKYTITIIEDFDDHSTIIRANRSESENNQDYMQDFENVHTGHLTDYHLEAYHLQAHEIIVPGTKIYDYVDEIRDTWSFEAEFTKLSSGWGIKMEYLSDIHGDSIRAHTFTKDGLLEEYEYSYSNYAYTAGEFYGTKRLYSINGEVYTNTVPGFPWFLILGFAFVGVLGLFFVLKRKKILVITSK